MVKTYDLKAVALIVGGYAISGYAEDGAIEFEAVSPDAEHAIGADGSVVVSRTNDDRVICRISVLPTSKSAADLDLLARTQHATPTAITPLSFLMIDSINGDEIADPYPVFLSRATPSKAKGPTTRTFEILLPSGKKNTVLAGLITI